MSDEDFEDSEESEDFETHEPPQPAESSRYMYPLIGSSIFIQLFGPQVQDLLRANPRLGKIVTRGFMGIGIFTSLRQLLGQTFLPSVWFRAEDELYQDLCKFVLDNKSKGFTLAWPLESHLQTAQSTAYRRQRVTPEIWWPSTHEGSKDVYYEKYGSRVFYHNGTLFLLSILPRRRRDSYSIETAALRALACNDKPIKTLLQQVWESRRSNNDEGTTHILGLAVRISGPKWERTATKSIRKLDTVNVRKEDRDRLIADASNYLAYSTREWYEQRGIPYRRGYLFHGPPGTGKSSLSLALAGYFKLDLYQVQLTHPMVNDALLLMLFHDLPRQCILLLEDVDSAGLNREIPDSDSIKRADRKNGKQARGGVTLAGLLNALDSPAAPEGHILIMTSNHPEHLDPALLRAGRIDYDFEFKLADRQMAKDIFIRMMKDDSKPIEPELLEQAEHFAGHIPEDILTPAAIQGYLLENVNKIDEALAGVEQWVKRTIEEDTRKAEEMKQTKAADLVESESESGSDKETGGSSRALTALAWKRAMEAGTDTDTEEEESDSNKKPTKKKTKGAKPKITLKPAKRKREASPVRRSVRGRK